MTLTFSDADDSTVNSPVVAKAVAAAPVPAPAPVSEPAKHVVGGSAAPAPAAIPRATFCGSRKEAAKREAHEARMRDAAEADGFVDVDGGEVSGAEEYDASPASSSDAVSSSLSSSGEDDDDDEASSASSSPPPPPQSAPAPRTKPLPPPKQMQQVTAKPTAVKPKADKPKPASKSDKPKADAPKKKRVRDASVPRPTKPKKKAASAEPEYPIEFRRDALLVNARMEGSMMVKPKGSVDPAGTTVPFVRNVEVWEHFINGMMMFGPMLRSCAPEAAFEYTPMKPVDAVAAALTMYGYDTSFAFTSEEVDAISGVSISVICHVPGTPRVVVARLVMVVDGNYGLGIFGAGYEGGVTTQFDTVYLRGPNGCRTTQKKLNDGHRKTYLMTSGGTSSSFDVGNWPMHAFAVVRLAQEYLAKLYCGRRPSLVVELNATVRVGVGASARTETCNNTVGKFVEFCLPLLPPLPKLVPSAPRAAGGAVPAPAVFVPAAPAVFVPAPAYTPAYTPDAYDENAAVDACVLVLRTLSLQTRSATEVIRFINNLTLMALNLKRRQVFPAVWTTAPVPDKLPTEVTRQFMSAFAQAQLPCSFILSTQNLFLLD